MNNNYLSPQNSESIPDPLASPIDKASDEFGLKIAKTIQEEWFGGGYISNNCLFSRRHKAIKDLRKYNRGQQGSEKYKKLAAREEGALDFMKMDWTPANYAEKFTSIVSNGISDEFYRLDIRSADRFSLLQKEKRIMEHKKNMASKDMLERAKAILGVDLRPKGFVPEDEDELNLYSEIKERPKQEIAEQITINFVKNISGWDYIKKQNDKDIVIADIMCARVYTDPINGVVIENVEKERYVHSYVERNDYKDAYYHGVVDEITINDVRRESGYDDATCREIAKMYGNVNHTNIANIETADIKDILNIKVNVLRFAYKSDKELVMKAYQDKKNRTKKVAFRDNKYNVPEGHEKSKLSRRFDTWYEGSYIIGTDKYIYNYKESENVAVDEMDRALPPFIVESTNLYLNEPKSFLSNITTIIDKLILADLKIQHLMMELKPDLIELDLDQLADLESDTKGGEKSSNWEMALNILNAKGVVFKKRINMGDDGIKDGSGARPIASQQGSALTALLNIWAHYYNLIRETTGINPARDGSLRPDALVGVNQMMELASNTVTKHIVDAAISFDKRICETVSARLKGIFSLREKSKHLVDMYEKAVGKHNIDALKSLKNRHLHDFGFNVEMVPAKEELNELKDDLLIALNEGTIDVSEKAEIMRIARYDIKQAIEYMRFVRKRRIKEKMKELEYNNKIQSQNNIEAAKAKTEGEIQLYATKKEIDLQAEAKQSAIRLREKQAMQQIEEPVRKEEFEQKVYIEQLGNLQTINLKKYDNDEKAKREKDNSTRQSQMIDQRLKNKGSIDFSDKFNLEDILN